MALINLVDSAAPFQSTTESDVNALPFTVRVNAGPPAVAVFGAMALMTGAAATVKVTAFDVTPPDRAVI